MLAASLAAQQPTNTSGAGNTSKNHVVHYYAFSLYTTGSFYKESLQSPGSTHHLSPSPTHYRSPDSHPPAAKRSLLLQHTSTPKRLILSESSSVSPRQRPALMELSRNQSATSTGSSIKGLATINHTY